MTRGPLPKKAIAAALEIAASRGAVLDITEFAESRQDFLLFTPGCTIFVRIKRIRARIVDPDQIGEIFRDDVRESRLIIQTPVISRQLWTLSPWGRWQYFVILDDRITEIRRDGMPEVPAAAGDGARQIPAGVPPATAGMGAPASPPTVAPG